MHSWFKVLWEYASYYSVILDLQDVQIDPVRERDRVFMEEAVKHLPPSQWESINRVRKYYKIYFMSQLLLSDGMTVDPTKYNIQPQPLSTM